MQFETSTFIFFFRINYHFNVKIEFLFFRCVPRHRPRQRRPFFHRWFPLDRQISIFPQLQKFKDKTLKKHTFEAF